MPRVKQLVAIVVSLAVWAAALFLPARTLHWPRAWAYIAVMFADQILAIAILPRDLTAERMKGPLQKGQPLIDKVLLIVFLLSYLAATVFIPVDVFHLHLLPAPPAIVWCAGIGLYGVGFWIITAVMLQNRYASAVVRHQSERGHRVIDTGLYHVVRHPMYAGLIPLIVGTALWLGSYAAAIASVVPIVLLAIRSIFEERFLRRELPGYEDYARRTRYRMVPFLW
jgi:protein-S-isoprenylcysteine O-methyltransferase Ste14